MNINGLPIEVLVILAGLAVLIVLWLALKFGKRIAKAALIGGILLLALLGMGALLAQGAANYQAAKVAADAVSVARGATTGLTIALVVGALIVGALGTVTMVALGVAGYSIVRWKLAEGDPPRWLPGWARRRRLPQRRQPIIYVVEEEPAELPADVDMAQWGW